MSFLFDHWLENPKISSSKSAVQKNRNSKAGSRFEFVVRAIPAIKGIIILKKGNRLNKVGLLYHKTRFIKVIKYGDLSGQLCYYHR